MSSEIISEAREKHEHWYGLFMKSLLEHNNGQVDESLAIPYHDCEFGVWLNETGLKLHGDLTEMHDLARVHRELHLHVCNIIERQGLHLKSRFGFGQLEHSKDHLIDLLDKLEEILD